MPFTSRPQPVVAVGRLFIGGLDGVLYAREASIAAWLWTFFGNGGPVRHSAGVLSDTVVFSTHGGKTFPLDAASGALVWQTPLYGQSLTDRYPVVLSDTAIYRSQPLYALWQKLSEGDAVMGQAGAENANWNAIRPYIQNYLASNPHKQTLFVLDATTGIARGVRRSSTPLATATCPPCRWYAPYTAYVMFRARQGIQTTGGSVHISSLYDADLGLISTKRSPRSSACARRSIRSPLTTVSSG